MRRRCFKPSRRLSPLSERSVLEKGGPGLFFRYSEKNHSFGHSTVFKTVVFIRAKHLNVSNTMVFLDTAVSSKYLENTLLPNGALIMRQRYEND